MTPPQDAFGWLQIQGLGLHCMAALLTVAGACREGERVEFAEAKDRLKSSWAVDRDDFARVKEQLKKKNAEHHVQNGRLSQSLKVCTSTLSTVFCLLKPSCCRKMSGGRSSSWTQTCAC